MNDGTASERDLKAGMFNYRTVIIIFLAMVAVGLIFALQQNKSIPISVQPKVLEVGRPAPDFTLPTPGGQTVRLSDYRGKVVLLNIWATWCAPCVAEMPSMEKLYNQLRGDDFEILAVSIDTDGSDVVRPFMRKHNLTCPALIDDRGITRVAYSTTGVPESFIINKQGLIDKKIIGPLDWAAPEVLQYFRKLIQS